MERRHCVQECESVRRKGSKNVAMGMLNPALSKIGAESVSLTFVTGTLSRIGGHLASAAGGHPLPDGQGPEDSHLRRARIDVSVWSGFLAGASLSGIAISHFHMWALLPACIAMIVLAPQPRIAPSHPPRP